jgi:hypothetical protein
MLVKIQKLLDNIEKNERTVNGDRRKFHFYSLRRYMKSTISNLGYIDFAEWQLGHLSSPYYDSPEKDSVAVWNILKLYLTFIDVNAIEARHKDLESKIEELERGEQKWQQGLSAYWNENQQLKDFILVLSKKMGVEPPKHLMDD